MSHLANVFSHYLASRSCNFLMSECAKKCRNAVIIKTGLSRIHKKQISKSFGASAKKHGFNATIHGFSWLILSNGLYFSSKI